jgi:hypothetical protein
MLKEKINVELTKEEAIVLYELLCKENENDDLEQI